MNKTLTKEILDLESYIEYNDDLKYKEIKLENSKRLILTYSKKRAKKDKHTRESAIEKLTKKLKKDSSLKSNISNGGYRKFINIENINQQQNDNNSCNIKISINEEKIKEDKKWDGIKGDRPIFCVSNFYYT